MRARRGVAGLAVALAVCAAALPTGLARADGDPASDVLLSQSVYLPYSGISTTLQRQLFAVCAAAQQAGYPVRIALIAAQSDLGVVPALFNKPEAYARFLSAELGGVVHGPVLVVMPAGVGLASQGHALSTGSLGGAHGAPSRGPDGLAAAALAAVPRLAAAAGHPLPASAADASSRASGASAGTVRDALIALVVLGLLAAAVIAGAFVARARRAVV
jgi:hypothetical protein